MLPMGASELGLAIGSGLGEVERARMNRAPARTRSVDCIWIAKLASVRCKGIW
jgi:hypothetical protein